MDKFLSLREELYQLRNDGLNAVPILSIIGHRSRQKKFKRKLKRLKTLVNSSRAHPRDIKRMRQILSLDLKTNFSPKNPGYGLKGDSYTTGFGVKFDKSCLKMLQKTSRLPRQRGANLTPNEYLLLKQSSAVNQVGIEHVDEVLSSKISRAVEQMNQCGENYPALKDHILNWLDSLKQTKVYCTDEHSNDKGRLAYTSPDYMPALMDKKLFFTFDSFIKFFLEPAYKADSYTKVRNTFVHEIFHLAHADNKTVWTHNDREQENFAVNCNDDDRLSDRVYLMSALCTSQKIYEKNPNDSSGFEMYMYDQLMAMKVQSCGMEKGCVRHFKSGMTSAKEAKRFCKNIVKMGKCRSSFDSSSVQLSPTVKRALRKLYQKFNAFAQKCYDSSVTGTKLVRVEECPTQRYISMPSNKPLGYLMGRFHNSNPDEAFLELLAEDVVKYLLHHPRTSGFLTSSEWRDIISGIELKTDLGITKYCAEQQKVHETIKRMTMPKVEECKLNR